MAQEPDFLSTSQVAKRLGVCESTANNLADRRVLQTIRVGPPPGRRLFLREDVEREAERRGLGRAKPKQHCGVDDGAVIWAPEA